MPRFQGTHNEASVKSNQIYNVNYLELELVPVQHHVYKGQERSDLGYLRVLGKENLRLMFLFTG